MRGSGGGAGQGRGSTTLGWPCNSSLQSHGGRERTGDWKASPEPGSAPHVLSTSCGRFLPPSVPRTILIFTPRNFAERDLRNEIRHEKLLGTTECVCTILLSSTLLQLPLFLLGTEC